MFCRACGKPLIQDAKHCTYCGTKAVLDVPATDVPAIVGNASQRRAGQHSSAQLIHWMIFGKGKYPAILVMLFVFAVYMSGRSPNRDGRIDSSGTEASSAPQPREIANEIRDAFDKLTPAEHVSKAKDLLATYADQADVQLAQKHLQAIPPNAPQAAQAGLLKRRAEARLREIEADANPLIVVKSTWHRGGFDSVGLWDVTFKNLSNKPVGNITFRTAYYSETGNVVSRGGVDSLLAPGIVQKVIPPLSSRTIQINDGFISSEAHRANFELVSWEFVPDRR